METNVTTVCVSLVPLLVIQDDKYNFPVFTDTLVEGGIGAPRNKYKCF